MLELLKFVLTDGYNFIGTMIFLYFLHVVFGQTANQLLTSVYEKKTALENTKSVLAKKD
jgi:hypothetical protein